MNTQTLRSPSSKWLPAVVILILIVLAIAAYFLLRPTAKPDVKAAAQPLTVSEGEAGKVGDLQVTEEALQLAKIKIEPVVQKLVAEKLSVSGSVQAGGDQLVKVTPRVTGKVVKLLAQSGDSVRAGQSLAVLESTELAQAQALYRQSSARVSAATKNLERQRQLLLSQHDIFIPLKPKSEWKEARTKPELIEKMNAALANIPGMKVSFTQPIEMRMTEMSEGVGIRSEVGAKVFGPDMAILQQKAIEVANVMRETQGGQDVSVEATAGLPVLQIRIRRGDIARYGINVGDVQDVIETAIGGATVGEVVEGAARYDMVMRFDEPYRNDPEAIRRLPVYGTAGQQVPLGMLADIESIEGPVQISRESGQRRVVVQANVRGRDLGSFVQEAQQKVASKVNLPPGYRVEWGGQYEHLQSASSRLIVVVPITFATIFVLLFITYRKVLDAARVFTGIPFAISGGVLALYMRGMPFSISAGVGFIALSGIAVLADMVMVQTIRNNLDAGMQLKAAVEHAAITRLRPVLMTALVAAIGFVPMALSTGTGAEVQKPLATVVIGGLITSTTLTLLVLPALYMLMSGRKGGKPGQEDFGIEAGLPSFISPDPGMELVLKIEPKETT